MTTTRQDMLQAFDALLQPARFKDYGPNGLQVEGKAEIRKLVSGVTASRALIEAAIADQADAIFVHHGLFWRGYDGRITGWMKQRIELLIKHDINLFAYHLPLDAHPEADALFGDQELGFIGSVDAVAPAQVAAHIQQTLGRSVTLVTGETPRPIRRMAWCTGGAQGFFEAAMAAGADGFLTGEISESQTHLARETGVSFFAAGHHATERYGAPAAAAAVAQQLGVAHRFIDIDNPA